MKDMPVISNRIKTARHKKGKSLQQVASAIGISKAHLWDLETGRSVNPTLRVLKGLSWYFETTISYLVGEVEE